MVKTKKGPLETGQIDESEILRARWTRCFISKEPLQKPIVACPLGRLYNKDAVINFLINKNDHDESSLQQELEHIKSLKSLINCQLKSNPKASNLEDTDFFVCPVTLREMNGKCKFYVTRGCGCVFSESALTQFSDTKSCLVCERPDFVAKRDLIPLYPKGEELEALKRALPTKKRHIKSDKDEDTSINSASTPTITDTASLIFEEIKSSASASGKEIAVLKRSKITDSIYHNNK